MHEAVQLGTEEFRLVGSSVLPLRVMGADATWLPS